MKHLILFIAFLSISITSFSQSEIANLYVGDIIDIDDVSIEFLELLSDSRCPQKVNCIRAGEAEVIVAIFKNGRFSHEKKLTFYASGVVREDNMQLFASDNLFIRGLTLTPYPVGPQKTPTEHYSLTIGIN